MDTATVAKANAAAKKAVVCRALAKFVGVLAVGIIEMVREVNEEAAPSCDAAIANIIQLTPLAWRSASMHSSPKPTFRKSTRQR